MSHDHGPAGYGLRSFSFKSAAAAITAAAAKVKAKFGWLFASAADADWLENQW